MLEKEELDRTEAIIKYVGEGDLESHGTFQEYYSLTNKNPYRTNWNWLMPVLLKILHERSPYSMISGSVYCSHGNSFNISVFDDEITNYQADSDQGNEIEAIFKVVSDYCLDYNTKKSKENV